MPRLHQAVASRIVMDWPIRDSDALTDHIVGNVPERRGHARFDRIFQRVRE
jgi:hypothetical protein